MPNPSDAKSPLLTDPKLLAAYLAHSLFNLGADAPHLVCNRIAFMCTAKVGSDESEQGGLAFDPLVKLLEKSIREFTGELSVLLKKAEDLAEAMRKRGITHLGQLQLR